MKNFKNLTTNQESKMFRLGCVAFGAAALFMILLFGMGSHMHGAVVRTEHTVVQEQYMSKKKSSTTKTIRYKSGNVYTGTVKDGKPDGTGKMTYSDEDSVNRDYYDGDWEDGVKEGTGKMVWNSGSFYQGEWSDDVCDGNGIYTYTSTSGVKCILSGTWVDGEMDGEFTLLTADGKKYKRVYDDGELVSEKQVTSSSSSSKSSTSSSKSSSKSSSSSLSSSSDNLSSKEKAEARKNEHVDLHCTKCHGEGTIACTQCDGTGYQSSYTSTPNYSGRSTTSREVRSNCMKCHGTGSITCTRCDGSGIMD